MQSSRVEAELTGRGARESRFERLHEAHFEAVRRYAWRRDPDTADDVAVETFMVAWRRLDDVPAEALPWLIGVARHVRLNICRSQRRQQNVAAELSQAVPHTDVQVDLLAAELPVEIALALDALAPTDREVLLLHAWEELSTAEIAAAVGCSKANASVRLHRAKRRFEKALEAARSVSRAAERASTATKEGAIDGC